MKSCDTETLETSIKDFAKGLDIQKQFEFEKILAAVKALSEAVPPMAHETQEAAEDEPKSIFDIFSKP